jgi:hypothetical protein
MHHAQVSSVILSNVALNPVAEIVAEQFHTLMSTNYMSNRAS